jgi:predicted secreted protein
MIKLQRTLAAILLFSSIGVNNAMAHDDETHYDRIHLSVSATAQLENDTMVATLSAQEEGSQAAELSAMVNKRIRNALELVKKHPQIKHQTNAYSSNPIYNKNKISGWRVSQSLRLESSNMALMSDVLGELQADLALQSMQFTVSRQARTSRMRYLSTRHWRPFQNVHNRSLKNWSAGTTRSSISISLLPVRQVFVRNTRCVPWPWMRKVRQPSLRVSRQ